MNALQEKGIFSRNIYMDKISGKDFNRPEYKKLIKKLQVGDIFWEDEGDGYKGVQYVAW
jgi:DNA invertase Pin-like site-specific DNA recombinase